MFVEGLAIRIAAQECDACVAAPILKNGMTLREMTNGPLHIPEAVILKAGYRRKYFAPANAYNDFMRAMWMGKLRTEPTRIIISDTQHTTIVRCYARSVGAYRAALCFYGAFRFDKDFVRRTRLSKDMARLICTMVRESRHDQVWFE